jgi:hypothetical protein
MRKMLRRPFYLRLIMDEYPMLSHIFRAFRFARILNRNRHACMFAASLAAFVPLSMSMAARATDHPASDYRFPLMTWFSAYAEGAKDTHYEVSTNLEIPAVWLFSPAGTLVQIVSSDNESTLDQLIQKFPSSEPQSPSKSTPSLDALNASFIKAGGARRAAASSGKAWTAVLLLSDSPACEHCGPYDRKISEIQKKHPDEIDVVRVTLTD